MRYLSLGYDENLKNDSFTVLHKGCYYCKMENTDLLAFCLERYKKRNCLEIDTSFEVYIKKHKGVIFIPVIETSFAGLYY